VQEVQTTLPEGTIIQNRYIVESLLGKGGFGAVYLVRDMRVRSNLFALKEVIDPGKQDRKRFLFEGELLKQLDHPALPRVYRLFEIDEEKRVYLLLDYVDGPNLEHLRQQQPEKRFQLSEVLHIMAPIMDAIAYLHNQQPPIMHRDIKPANIIVPEKGDEPVLVDFCIAKLYDPESTTAAVRHASRGYGAPEQYS
jgi:serine/threonine protein kinase